MLNVYCEIFRVAWYDMELSSYQSERQDGELAKVFEERSQQEKDIIMDHLRPKGAKEEQPEWTQMAKSKKGDEYYSKLREVRDMKEVQSVPHANFYIFSNIFVYLKLFILLLPITKRIFLCIILI